MHKHDMTILHLEGLRARRRVLSHNVPHNTRCKQQSVSCSLGASRKDTSLFMLFPNNLLVKCAPEKAPRFMPIKSIKDSSKIECVFCTCASERGRCPIQRFHENYNVIRPSQIPSGERQLGWQCHNRSNTSGTC